MKNDDQPIVWLNNAHAMEHSLVHVLENHSKDANKHPALKNRIDQHLAETRRHAQLVEECLDVLDEKPSGIKAAVSGLAGSISGAAAGIFHDEPIKNLISDYAAEHAEIATHESLIAAAEELGHARIAAICSEILKDERDMAEWLMEQIPQQTRSFLQREAVAR